MRSRFIINRKRGLVTTLALLLLGLAIWTVRPAAGLKDSDAQGLNSKTAAEAKQQAQAQTVASIPAGAADVIPEVLYYHQDATGNLAAMTDDGGQVVWRADLRPFGQGSATSTTATSATASSADHPLRFAGQPNEAISGGLYHLGAREYDPLTGRFLSPDPILLGSVKREVPQRFNQYSYALNNPYRYHDASGLEGTEFTATNALKKFLRFYEAKLGPNPGFAERTAAFVYGPLPEPIFPSDVAETNSEPIRNRAGQEVDLDWGARFAGYAVASALYDRRDLVISLSPAEIAKDAKRKARELYTPSKLFWNGVDWLGQQLGTSPLTGPYRPNDPNIRGIELLIDYIAYGGDLRDYFDNTQLPPKR